MKGVGDAVVVDSSRPGISHGVDGVAVGSAEYPNALTGCTVVRFDDICPLAADRRGGSVGIVGEHFGAAHAICLAGGSILGLEATAGVTAALFDERGRRTGFSDLPIVAGAIIYDFGPRDTTDYPDLVLGRAAMTAATPGWVPIGRCGAGIAATVGKGGHGEREWGGQGAAAGRVGEHEVLVLAVVNAVGVICDRTGAIVAGNRHADGTRHHLGEDWMSQASGADEGNTTLTVVITDARLHGAPLQQFARQVHGSMARAIRPFHTPRDGDVLFAAATGRSSAAANAEYLAEGVSELAWDSVLRAVDDLAR